jgi:hypothetical protein
MGNAARQINARCLQLKRSHGRSLLSAEDNAPFSPPSADADKLVDCTGSNRARQMFPEELHNLATTATSSSRRGGPIRMWFQFDHGGFSGISFNNLLILDLSAVSYSETIIQASIPNKVEGHCGSLCDFRWRSAFFLLQFIAKRAIRDESAAIGNKDRVVEHKGFVVRAGIFSLATRTRSVPSAGGQITWRVGRMYDAGIQAK